ncbi:MAG: hypothetical protein HC936_00490 [Leptolyngbyaceae cyanobacterium SU_3_3]|nr:hypothetical protein [Leptolyngbyaceae cyanobacterium SU_3_3]
MFNPDPTTNNAKTVNLGLIKEWLTELTSYTPQQVDRAMALYQLQGGANSSLGEGSYSQD